MHTHKKSPAAGDSHPAPIFVSRDWKEYLGESLLIIFSVVLALSLTELLNDLHAKSKTDDLLKNVYVELTNNRKAIQEIRDYDAQVLDDLNRLLSHPEAQAGFITNGELHLERIAPRGLLFRYLRNDAWNVAKNNDILSRLGMDTLTRLTRVYEDLGRMGKVEEEAARVLFDWRSRDPQNLRTTLILLRDIYHGWAVDRIPGLLLQIDEVLVRLN
ncbi:MAG: hypothetical protein LWW85_06605 [Marinilabiliales bacterium]|nr:hypothetical protein [Marinilabiliales bacterium]